MLVHGGLRGFQIVELDDLEARQQGREAVAELLLIGGADRRHGAAVEGVGECDQRVLFRLALGRSEEHTSELQSLMRISYAVFCLKKKKTRLDTMRLERQS